MDVWKTHRGNFGPYDNIKISADFCSNNGSSDRRHKSSKVVCYVARPEHCQYLFRCEMHEWWAYSEHAALMSRADAVILSCERAQREFQPH
jgi:hypothetical protein